MFEFLKRLFKKKEDKIVTLVIREHIITEPCKCHKVNKRKKKCQTKCK